MSMSYPFEIPIILELGNCTLSTRFGRVAERCPEMATQTDVLDWIKHKVSIFPFFQHFKGSFKGEHYDSDGPPHKMFKNDMSCKPFVSFV